MTTVSSPRRRDPEATRASILEAAETLFVEKGFAATSMSDIAQRATVTKSLIHHHFGSKEDLWTEVKRKRVSHYADIQLAAIQEGGAGSILETSLPAYFRFVKDNPEWVRLSLWMALEDPRLSDVVRPDLVQGGTEVLKREQQEGRLRGDVEARHVLAMLVSLSTHWFMARESFRQASLAGPDGEKADEEYLEDLLKIFLDGVQPRG